jgi:hypothetical protein
MSRFPVGKTKMASRLVEWRVDDRIFDNDLTHALSSRAERADVETIRPDLFTVNCSLIAIIVISKEMIRILNKSLWFQ